MVIVRGLDLVGGNSAKLPTNQEERPPQELVKIMDIDRPNPQWPNSHINGQL